MRLNKNLVRVLVIGFCLFVWGILSKAGYADDLTPTPTWVWKSHPKKSVPPSYTPSVADISGEDEDYGGKEEDSKELSKYGHHSGTALTEATMKPQPESPSNFKIETGDGMARLTWDDKSNAGAYILYISEDGKTFKRRIMKPFKKRDITIGVLQNGKTYYFGVVCVGSYGQETKMTIKSVVPKKGAVMSKEAIKSQSFLIGREVCV